MDSSIVDTVLKKLEDYIGSNYQKTVKEKMRELLGKYSVLTITAHGIEYQLLLKNDNGGSEVLEFSQTQLSELQDETTAMLCGIGMAKERAKRVSQAITDEVVIPARVVNEDPNFNTFHVNEDTVTCMWAELLPYMGNKIAREVAYKMKDAMPRAIGKIWGEGIAVFVDYEVEDKTLRLTIHRNSDVARKIKKIIATETLVAEDAEKATDVIMKILLHV